MTSKDLLVYLSGGPNKAHFRNPDTGEVFKNKKMVQEYLSKINAKIIFLAHPNKNMDYVIFPNERKGSLRK